MANKEKNLKPAKAVDNQTYRKARIGKAPKKTPATLSDKAERDPNWLAQFLPKGKGANMRRVYANVARALPHVVASMPRRVAMHPAMAAPYRAPAGVLVVLARDLYPPTVKPRSKRGWTTPKVAA